ncbi:MAG: glycosyltransferase, partial [Chloroflexota bacterium]
RQLARELTACGFSLNLQSRQEPFGMVIIESMRAGCIVLASPVGAYPELIRDGENGFLMGGAHSDPGTHRRAADLILELTRRPAAADAIRRRAIAAPLDWDEVAQRWEEHWQRMLQRIL